MPGLETAEQDFLVWPFRSGRFGLAVLVWAISVRPFRSGRFGLAVSVWAVSVWAVSVWVVSVLAVSVWAVSVWAVSVLAVSVWPIRSGCFGQGTFRSDYESCSNLTLTQSRAVLFKTHSLHQHTVSYQRRRHSTQSVLPSRFAIAASAIARYFTRHKVISCRAK